MDDPIDSRDPRISADHAALLAHAGWVRRLARALASDREQADEIEQRAWASALERPPASATSLRGWWFTVVRNVARKLGRDERRRKIAESPNAEPLAPSAEDAVARGELHRAVVDAVLALDEPYRTAILLRFFDELPPREVAARLAIPVETARTRIKRGLAQLEPAIARRAGRDPLEWRAAIGPLLTVPVPSKPIGVPTMVVRGSLAAAVFVFVAPLLWRSSHPSASRTESIAADEPTPTAGTRAFHSPLPIDPLSTDPTPASAPIRVEESAPPRTAQEAPERQELPRSPDATPTTPPARFTIEGSIVDEEGRSLASAIVLASSRRVFGVLDERVAKLRMLAGCDEKELGATLRTTAASDGRFAFVEVEFDRDWEIAAIDASGRCCNPRRIPRRFGQLPTRLELGLPRTIRGHVIDPNGANEPAATVTVGCEFGDGDGGMEFLPVGRELALDAAARFVLEVPLFRTLDFDAVAEKTSHAHAQISHDAQLREHSVDLVLVAGRSTTVRGRLVTPELEPLTSSADLPEDVRLIASNWSLFDQADGFEPKQISQLGLLDRSDGSFSVDVTDHDMSIALVAGDVVLGALKRPESPSSPFADPAELVVDLGRLRSASRLGSLRIHLRHSEDGSDFDPKAATIDLVGESMGRPARNQPTDHVRLGRWVVVARAEGCASEWAAVELTEARPEAEITLSLARADRLLYGLILKRNGDGLPDLTSGAPEARCSIRLYEQAGESWRAAAAANQLDSNSDSGFRVPGLKAQRYLVVAERMAFAPAFAEVDLTQPLTDPAGIVLVQQPGERVIFHAEFETPAQAVGGVTQLVVIDEHGIPLVDWCHPAAGLKSGGSVAFADLARGRYHATLFVTGHAPATVDFDVAGPTSISIPVSRR